MRNLKDNNDVILARLCGFNKTMCFSFRKDYVLTKLWQRDCQQTPFKFGLNYMKSMASSWNGISSFFLANTFFSIMVKLLRCFLIIIFILHGSILKKKTGLPEKCPYLGFSIPCFLAFVLTTEIYSVNPPSQSKCGKIPTKKFRARTLFMQCSFSNYITTSGY